MRGKSRKRAKEMRRGRSREETEDDKRRGRAGRRRGTSMSEIRGKDEKEVDRQKTDARQWKG